MIVNAAVLIVNNQQRGALPQVRVLPDGIVDRRNKIFTGLHIVIRMLIARQLLAAVVPFVVGIVGLNKAVLRQLILLAVLQKLFVSAENLRLAFQQIDHFHGRTGLVEIVKLGSLPGLQQPLVNAKVFLVVIKDIHAHLAEGASIVSERPITNRRPGDRREPAVEDRIAAR